MLNRTPFYAEGGGQLADTGRITGDGFEVEVHDVQSPVAGLNVHRGKVVSGEITLDATVSAEVDPTRRRAVSRSHSATHLVHAGVRRALGTQAAQAGSLNAPGRLRFDFTSPGGAVPPSVLADVEDEVNDVLLNDYDVRAEVTTLDEARKSGAIAFFGEKYGEKVRVITIGDYSKELCGGTHVHRSGEIGVVKLLSEASIGAGVRRVEALVGMDAFRFLAREHVLVGQLAEQFKVPGGGAAGADRPDRRAAARGGEGAGEAARRAAAVLGGHARRRRRRTSAAPRSSRSPTPDGIGGNDLRSLASEVRNRLGARPGVVALFSGGRREGQLRRGDHVGGPRPGARGGQAGAGVRAGHRRPRRRQAGHGAGRRQQPGRRARGGRGAAPRDRPDGSA